MVAALAHALRVVGSIGMLAFRSFLGVSIHMIACMTHKSGSVILVIMLTYVHFLQIIKYFYQMFRVLRVRLFQNVIIVEELI